MPNIMFHSGSFYLIRSGIAVPQPKRIMTVQETSFDFKGDVKELMGENQFAVDVATGSIKITGKAKNGQLDPAAMNELFFGQTIATGSRVLVQGESVTVAAGTATAAGGANFDTDLGVVNSATGEIYTRVSSAPALKQYSLVVATGVYTFNATENGNVMLLDYIKRDSAGGTTLTLNNQLAGTTVTFKGVFARKFRDGRMLTLELQQCIADSLQFAAKLNDYVMPEFNFAAFADSTNKVMSLSVSA